MVISSIKLNRYSKPTIYIVMDKQVKTIVIKYKIF